MTVNCIVLSDVTERMSLDFFYVSKLCHTNDRSVVYHSNCFSSPLHYFLDLNEPKMRCFHTFCAQQKKKWQISCKKFDFFCVSSLFSSFRHVCGISNDDLWNQLFHNFCVSLVFLLNLCSTPTIRVCFGDDHTKWTKQWTWQEFLVINFYVWW